MLTLSMKAIDGRSTRFWRHLNHWEYLLLKIGEPPVEGRRRQFNLPSIYFGESYIECQNVTSPRSYAR